MLTARIAEEDIVAAPLPTAPTSIEAAAAAAAALGGGGAAAEDGGAAAGAAAAALPVAGKATVTIYTIRIIRSCV